MSMIMAESFDAPMTDSGDIDVSMYSGGMATADSWLSAEASMGDVTYSTDTATFDYMQEGIEVEMLDDLDDDAAITEYEMADDGQAYHDHELEDIEVLDVSRGASLPPAVPIDLAVDVSAEDPMMHMPPYDGGAPVASDSHYPVEPVGDDSVLYPETEPTTYSENSAEASASVETSAVVDGDAPPVVSSSASGVLAVVGDDNAAVESTVFSTPNHAEEDSAIRDPHAASHSHLLAEDCLREAVLASNSDVEQTSAAVQADTTGLHPSEDSVRELAADDPHEISDGVYIDPPPPVLLSLPPSAEYAECCLFNQPQSHAPLTSPEGNKSKAAAEPLRLLLHDRPTLYYEPLSSVFDALRHEECIESLPGSADAELILDAYELQLAICEDNVYAHEVTLHELDVIHGGSDLHGPLRLRLKFVAPRFVTRYHLLRDQIARLNLTADGDELHSGAAASDSIYEQEAEVDHEPESVVHNHAEDRDTREGFDEHDDGPIEDNEDGLHGDFHDGVDELEADTLALKNRSADDQGVSLHTAVPEQPTGEDDAATVDEPSREVATVPPEADEAEGGDLEHEHGQEDGEDGEGTLDANEVHEYADAEDGGDYVEHDEFRDDDEEFGNDLPEEIGGQTENATYFHTGAVENGAEVSAYVEEEGASTYEDVLEASLGEAGQDDLAAASWSQDDEDPHLRINGLDTNGHTDSSAHLDSADNDDELSQDDGASQLQQHDDVPTTIHPVSTELSHTFEDDNLVNEESTTLSSDGDELADDWDDGDDVLDADPAPEANPADALSRKSSSATLASKSSKRTYDEVELDDFDDDPSLLEAASSLEAKRPRVQ